MPYFFFLGWDRDGKLEKIFTGQPFFNSVEFPPILQLCSHLPAWMLWNCSCKDCVTHLFPSNIFYYQFSFFFIQELIALVFILVFLWCDLYCKLWHLHHVFMIFFVCEPFLFLWNYLEWAAVLLLWCILFHFNSSTQLSFSLGALSPISVPVYVSLTLVCQALCSPLLTIVCHVRRDIFLHASLSSSLIVSSDKSIRIKLPSNMRKVLMSKSVLIKVKPIYILTSNCATQFVYIPTI